MAKQLKITGDTSQLKKSLLDLSRTTQRELGRSKLELFSPDTKKFLRTEAIKQSTQLNEKMKLISKSIESHRKSLQGVVAGSKEELRIKEKIVKATKQIADMESQRGQVGNLANRLGPLGGVGGMMRGMGGRLGGVGRFLASPMGIAGGAALGVGAYGLSRMRAGFNTFESGVQDRLMLRGRGAQDMELLNPQRAAGVGLNALSLRANRLRSMDVFGRGGASQEAVMQRAGTERAFGVQGGTFMDIGAQLRGVMGGKGANRAVMTIQAGLIASGIRDEIGPFLETSAQMLTSLNERGFTFDDTALAALSAFTAATGNIERSSALLSTVDQTIRSSSGERNAFFQNVFNKAGIGGSTIGGAQAAIQAGGLFGSNLEKFGGMSGVDKSAFQALGIGGGQTFTKVGGGIVNMLDKLFGTDAEIGKQLKSKDKNVRDQAANRRLQRNIFAQKMLGAQSAPEAAEITNLLKEATSGGVIDGGVTEARRSKIEEKLKEIRSGSTELGNLKQLNETSEGQLDILNNIKTSQEDLLGEQIAPAVNIMKNVLITMDGYLSKFIGNFITLPQQELEDSIGGKDVLTRKNFEQLTAGDPKKQEQIRKQLVEQRDLEKAKLAKIPTGGGGFLAGTSAERLMSESRVKSLNASIQNTLPRNRVAGGGSQNSEKVIQDLLDQAQGKKASVKDSDQKKASELQNKTVEILSDISRSNRNIEKSSKEPAELGRGTARTVK